MKKRMTALLLAALILSGACGCKDSKKTASDTVSYVTEWEEYDETVEGEAQDTASGKGDSSKKNNSSKKDNSKGNSGKNNGSVTSSDINSGTSVTKGLDFGGKTFTKTIIGAIPNRTVRKKEAFEKKYNCKIKLVSLQWEQYNSQIATAMSSGQPYDICGLQSYFWPEAGVQGLYEPLNDYITQSDLYNSKTGIGIDLEKSKEFEMNGNLYGVSNHSGVFAEILQVLFYNKLMFEEAGLEDPLKLYNSGKWTWDKFFEYAKKLKNESKGKYIIGQELEAGAFTLSDGYKYVTKKNGKVTANLSDSKYLNGLKKYSEFCKNYMGPKGYGDDPTEFYNGNYYMFYQSYTYGKYYMYDTIVNSAAFDNDFSNLGVVPFPTPDGKHTNNPGGGPQAKGAGKGSKDPRIVIAWTKFDLEFDDPEADSDPYQYSTEIDNVIKKCFDNINYGMCNYKTSSQTVSSLYGQIDSAAKTGGDYVKLINDNKATIQSIIDDSLGQK